MDGVWTALAVLAVLIAAALVPWLLGRHRSLGSQADQKTFHTLHTANRAAGALRQGLNAGSAARALKPLHGLLSAPTLVVSDSKEALAWDGPGDHHRSEVARASQAVVDSGSARVDRLRCLDQDCPVREVISAPLTIDGTVAGTLQALVPSASAGAIRASNEVAAWVSGQLDLAAFDQARTRLAEAELRALRAQISPHFIYNSLSTIASFVRTDPERARALLVEFADFTRYSFRRHGAYSTLADELRSIERYLELERARFGERLHVTIRVAPETLPVILPFLTLQPLVENAVRHGLEPNAEPGHITVIAEDAGPHVRISVEDDGVGEEPERLQRALDGDVDVDSVGLGNVDERLRTTFGDDHGLIIETAPHAGTKVTLTIPKFAAHAHPEHSVG